MIRSEYEELVEIDEIGEKIARSVYEFFRNESNLLMIKSLQAVGVMMFEDDKEIGNTLQGAKFVITGTLQNYSRNEMKELIEYNGGKVISAVSKNLSYIITGSNPGSKLAKAKEIESIKILSESEFLKMIKK